MLVQTQVAVRHEDHGRVMCQAHHAVMSAVFHLCISDFGCLIAGFYLVDRGCGTGCRESRVFDRPDSFPVGAPQIGLLALKLSDPAREREVQSACNLRMIGFRLSSHLLRHITPTRDACPLLPLSPSFSSNLNPSLPATCLGRTSEPLSGHSNGGLVATLNHSQPRKVT